VQFSTEMNSRDSKTPTSLINFTGAMITKAELINKDFMRFIIKYYVMAFYHVHGF